MDKFYDLVIIGGGPAGTPVAMEYATLNSKKKILLIDKKGQLGGECLFDGCIPSKILEVSSKYIEDEFKLENLGISHTPSKINWSVVTKKKIEILKKRSKAATDTLLSFDNVELFKGTARFTGKNSIEIINRESSEIKKVTFKKAVIATGSRTFIPPFKGNGVEKALTNDIFFDNMKLPKTLTIIGAGPMGIELSQILANYGVQINLVNNLPDILSMIDKKYSKIILDKIRTNKNIELFFDVNVETIDYEDKKGFSVFYKENKSKNKQVIKSEQVLIATGRTPNLEELNLDKADIVFNKKGIKTDDYLQTSNEDVYAVGDIVLGYPKFAHTASYGAHIITQNLFVGRNKFKTDFSKISWVIFSNPNFAFAGLSEKDANKQGIDIIIGEYNYAIDAKAQIENEDLGYLKFIVNKKTLEIIGVQILNESANHIAGEAALIVANKLTLVDLINSIHPHPTLSESFVFLAKQMMGNVMKERMKNPLFKVALFIKKWI